MRNLCVIILHYQTIEETQKSIDSFWDQKLPEGYQQKIIVVDNGSTNGSGFELERKYKASNVTVLRNEKNIGFTNGNNVGFQYAKTHFSPFFLVLANNDTYTTDKSFWDKLIGAYEKERFNVAGPRIISLLDNSEQNPERRQYYSIRDILVRKRKLYTLNILRYIRLDVISQKIYLTIKSKLNRNHNSPIFPDDYQLFGAFLIFDEKYVNRYEGLEPLSFMYGEENILRYIIERDNLKMSFIQDIVVFHKGGASTKETFGFADNKRKFYYENNLLSCEALIDYIKKDKGYMEM